MTPETPDHSTGHPTDHPYSFLMPRVGTVFKSYPELCAAMGEPVLSSNMKTSQIARWRTQIELVQIGRTWRITRLLSEAEIKSLGAAQEKQKRQRRLLAETNLDDKLSINQRKFLLMAEIRDILQTTRENSENPEDYEASKGLAIDFSYSQLDDLLGLVNDRFSETPKGGNEVEREVEEFCSEIRNKNKEVSLSLCESVIRSGLASGYKTVAVKIKDDPRAKVIPAEQLWKILEVEVDVFKAMKVSGKSEIHILGRWKEFGERRGKILEDSYGITNIWGVFVFFTTEKICNWFLENNARIYHRKEKLRYDLNKVNMVKLEKHMKKEYYDSLVGHKVVKMTVPKLEGFSNAVLDAEGKPVMIEVEREIAIRAKPEDYLEKRNNLLVERVWLGEMR
jgi:hypothetical protein